MTISNRRDDILARIDQSSKGRANAGRVTLVAVSKVQPDARIRDMLTTGQSVFGENRVQEAQGRWGDTFAQDRAKLSLHLIGPLQTNKAQDAVDFFDVIETLDREKLAKFIAKAAQASGKCPDIFIQVNTGEEPQKAGVMPANIDAFIKTARETYDLPIKGLMCIPPADGAPSPHFIMLSQMAALNGLAGLSMGMSGDFETAAALGATHVRVGSALFGAREQARLKT